MSRKIVTALSAVLCCAGACAQDLKFSGYYKNLLVNSETVAPAGQSYALDVNRLRLELKGNLSEHVALDLQYDNEVWSGNYLHTAQFAAWKDLQRDPYWDLDRNWGEGNSWYGRQRLYRGNVTLSSGDTDLRLGRQRIAWGTGRFWSPLDLLNPLNPVTIEREERLGSDALLIERKFGPVSRASFAYVPAHDTRMSTSAARWHGNAAAIDYSLMVANAARTHVIGADFAGQVGKAGWRAEIARFAPEAAGAFSRALVGIDYAFANSLNLTGEVYFNGAGAKAPTAYDFASLISGRIQAVGRRYAGFHASYDITPLLKAEADIVVNAADRSRYVGAMLTYSVTSNLELRAGLQRFAGASGSEFRRLPNTAYAQLQRFF